MLKKRHDFIKSIFMFEKLKYLPHKSPGFLCTQPIKTQKSWVGYRATTHAFSQTLVFNCKNHHQILFYFCGWWIFGAFAFTVGLFWLSWKGTYFQKLTKIKTQFFFLETFLKMIISTFKFLSSERKWS